MNTFIAHRISALNAVLHPDTDPEYELRRILRWYSKTFGVPLRHAKDVYDIPLDDLLQDYYEAKYEELEGQEADEKDPDQRSYLARERDMLCETEEERQARLIVEAEERQTSDKFLRIVEEENKAAKSAFGARLPAPKKGIPFGSGRDWSPSESVDMQDLIQKSARAEQRLLNLAGKIKETKKSLQAFPDDEGELDIDSLKMGDLPPNINMKFAD